MMSSSTTSQTILSASAFVGSIGVNTHVSYAWGGYNDLALVEDDLKYLGVTKLRDGLSNIPGAQPVLDGLAAAGYKFDLGISSSVPGSGAAGLQQYLSALDAFEAKHPGSIIALEGLNEVNHQAFSYNGSSTISAAAEFQAAFYTAVKGDAALANISVYNVTLAYNDPSDFAKLGNLSGSTDFANAHAYASTGTTPSVALASELATAASAAPGKPIVITETGYTTLSNTPYLGVDETVQAKSILNTLVDAYKDGVSTTYLYQLLDASPSNDPSDPESHFGLFNADGTPKFAATAIHNLTTILSDNGTGGQQPTAALNYSLTGLPPSGNSMVLGKSNGAYELVVWAEPKAWDGTTGTEINNPSQSVTVNLGGVHHSVSVYDPLSGTTAIATYTDVSQIVINVSDHPVIIEIDAPPPTSSTPVGPVNVSGTAAQIVAELSDLNAATTLKTITLTDSHVLSVATEATMNYMISHYGNALAAIQGGYQFSVTTSTSDWSVTKIFSSSATLVSTTTSVFSSGVITSKQTVNASGSTDTITYTAGVATQEVIVQANGNKTTKTFAANGSVTAITIQNTDGTASTAVYANGVQTQLYVTNIDGTHINYFYGITGQPYTTQILQITTTGVVKLVTEKRADGSVYYTKALNADGSTTARFYDATTQTKTTEIVTYANGSSLTNTFTTSGTITEAVAKALNGTVTTTVYTAGVKSSVYIANSDGSKETQQFDSTGHLTSDYAQHTDGSSSTTLYSSGVKTKVYITNADASRDYYFYNVTGQTYANEHDHLNAAGNIVSVTRTHADGSLAYTQVINSDGSKVTDQYDSTGNKTSEVTNGADGSTTTDLYNTSGALTQHVVKAASGTTTTNYSGGYTASIYVTNADGSKDSKLFDSTGHLTSDYAQNKDGSYSTTVYAAGVETAMYLTNADGSHDNYFYNVTGQSYTNEHDQLDAAGHLLSVTRTHADGSLAYTQVINSDGSKVTDQYDATGHKTSEVANHADGSTITDLYDTAGTLTQDVAKTASGTTTTNYSGGYTASIYVTNADGSKDSKLFDSAGHLTSDYAQNKDGSSSTTVYTASVKTALYATNADSSHDNYFYNVSGQTYTNEHDHLDASSHVQSVTRTHADGSLDYSQVINSDGSKVTDLYDSTGSKTQEILNNADGTSDVFKFVVSGSPGAVEHDSYAANGSLLTIDTLNSNGTHNVLAVTAGLTISGGNGDDTFSTAPGTTTVTFDHGNDVINNFHAGTAANHDTISILKALVSDYSQLQFTQNGTDTLIHISATDSITLKNVYATNLSQSDFHFV